MSEDTVISGENQEWYNNLSPEHRENPTIQKYKTKSLDEFAKAHVNVTSMVGNSFRFPGENATEEERNSFLDKFRPESPEKYLENLPKLQGGNEWDPEAMKAFSEKAYQVGLQPEQFRAALEVLGEVTAADIEKTAAAQSEREARLASYDQALHNEWGMNYSHRTGIANGFFEKMFGDSPELVKMLNESGATRHPDFVKRLHYLGTKVSEAPGIMPAHKKVEEAQAQINQIRNDTSDPRYVAYKDKNHPEHEKVNQLMNDLYAQTTGEA